MNLKNLRKPQKEKSGKYRSLILPPTVLTFCTRKNPCFWFITCPGLSEDPKCFIIPTFRTFNPCFRKKINLLFKDDSLFLFLFLHHNGLPTFFLFRSTGVTNKNIAFWKHQYFTFRTKLHIKSSGMHPL